MFSLKCLPSGISRLVLYHKSVSSSILDSRTLCNLLPDLNVPISDGRYWTSKIHDLCFRHGQVDRALGLLQRLRFLGYQPDSLNLSSIVHGFAAENRFQEAHEFLLASIFSGCFPDERTSNVLIARLLDSGSASATSHVVYAILWAKPEFVPSLINYNRWIDQLCQDVQRPDAGHRLLFDMICRGHSPNVITLTTLVRGYGDSGHVDEAQKLFDEMPQYGLVPNSLTYSTVIGGILMMRDLERGKEMMNELWKVMEYESDFSLNSAGFKNLVDSLCKYGYFNEIFEIAEQMPQGNNVNEEFSYAQLIDSLCKVERFHGASRIVYIMKRKGYFPSFVSYNYIIHGLCKEGGCMRAFQMLQEGTEFGYSPSEFTYKTILEALCQVQDLEKAREVFQLMLRKKGTDEKRTYNIFLRALCFMDNSATEILNILVCMLQNGCLPDLVTLNTVIKGFCKMGQIKEAQEMLDDMLMGKFSFPDVVTFTTLMSGLLEVGKLQEALQILHKLMPSKGVQPNVISFNAVLQGLFKLGLVTEAKSVYEKMFAENVPADRRTYTIIIEGLCKCNLIEEAKKFWDDSVWPSNQHDNFVYATILKGFCNAGNYNDACHFLYELVDYGIIPNVVCYNIVINEACKLGMKREAYQVLREMRRCGVTPDSVTWRTLDKLHSKTLSFTVD